MKKTAILGTRVHAAGQLTSVRGIPPVLLPSLHYTPKQYYINHHMGWVVPSGYNANNKNNCRFVQEKESKSHLIILKKN